MDVNAAKKIFNNENMTFEERQREIDKQKEKEEDEQKREKNSPFKNFIQVNKDFYKAEDWLMGKSAIAYRIFRFLINNMDTYNAVICSYHVLQETFGISQPTVARAIKLLKDKGYIYILKSGTSNVYALNDKIVWNSWGKNYPYSKFPANVILSISEQENGVQTQIKALKHKEIVIKEDTKKQP
jgi:DNA-binding transcriptional ArsR family regulator